MAVVLGLCVALVYGTADFLGGLATKRNPAATTVALAQCVGATLVPAVAVLSGSAFPGSSDVLRSAGAGLAAMVAVMLLFSGLASGSMGVVAPLSAVGAAVLPVGYGIATGERPSPLTLTGMGLALVAIALIAAEPGGGGVRRSEFDLRQAVTGLLAGFGFGAGFILFSQTATETGVWPVGLARIISVVTLAVVALAVGGLGGVRERFRAAPGSGPLIVGNGGLDALALCLYATGARLGPVAVVATLGSLYPAATVVLASVVLHEQLHRVRVAGMAIALVGVTLIVAG